jgi:hypothetical protein
MHDLIIPDIARDGVLIVDVHLCGFVWDSYKGNNSVNRVLPIVERPPRIVRRISGDVEKHLLGVFEAIRNRSSGDPERKSRKFLRI